MIRRFVRGKVYVFIDAANIFYSQHSLKWKISFKRLYKFLKSNCDLGKVYFYYTKSERSKNQEIFFKIIKDCGYILRIKPLKIIRKNKLEIIEKGNMDVELTMDIMASKDEFETIILLSGDSDFASLMALLRKEGKKVIVMSTRGHISKELIDIAHKYIDLKKLKQELYLKPLK